MKKFWKMHMCAMLFVTTIMATTVMSAPSLMTAAAVSAEPTALSDTGVATPYAEETTWYLRKYNGHLQKRLWSNTRCIWLTDWIDCYTTY